tara:strand:+ start:1114 stop:1935 length:822 start_codon:yes stop_codon:yes gene_type:complete
MSSSTDEEPLSVVIDGLNVMGHASNDWNIPSWLGLVNLLSIFKEISKTMNKELLIITVLREHANIQRQSLSFDGGRNIIKIEWPEFLDAIRSMSKLIILSDKSDREDDDYITMALTKLNSGYFVSNDLKIYKHVEEEESWACLRRIKLTFNPLSRGIILNIPDGELKQVYDKIMNNVDHNRKQIGKITKDKRINRKDIGDKNIGTLLDKRGKISVDSLPKTEIISCLYCNSKFDSKEKVELHISKTGHNQFRNTPPFAELLSINDSGHLVKYF